TQATQAIRAARQHIRLRRKTYPYASHEDPHVRPKTVIPSTVQGAAAPDLEQFRLRRFLEALDDSELDQREEPVDLADAAAIMEGNPRAVWFKRPGGGNISLAGSVAASRTRLAKAFDTTPQNLLATVRERLAVKGKLVEVTREEAPVQQVVLTGDACDFT